jgi:hypothetical protein
MPPNRAAAPATPQRARVTSRRRAAPARWFGSGSRSARPEPVADEAIDSFWVFELEEMADARDRFGLGARRESFGCQLDQSRVHAAVLFSVQVKGRRAGLDREGRLQPATGAM